MLVATYDLHFICALAPKAGALPNFSGLVGVDSALLGLANTGPVSVRLPSRDLFGKA